MTARRHDPGTPERGVNVGSLFSGAGLMDWGLTLAGFEHAWFCEIDPYARRVLAARYPGVSIYEDVRELRDPQPVDVLAGGFPCQPFSAAGKREGMADERWLWPEFARLVGELRPRYVLVENVPGLAARGGGMGRVLGDLAECGYDAEWDRIFAASVGAPHLRERLFVVAYPNGEGEPGRAADESSGQGLVVQDVAHAEGEPIGAGLRSSEPTEERRGRSSNGSRPGGTVQDPDSRAVESRRLRWGAPQTGGAGWWAAEPDVGRVAHGVPDRLDRLAAIGNGVVPQIAQWLGERILEREALRLSP
jgi:DNA (cytosine-5)-methyltransferase 1